MSEEKAGTIISELPDLAGCGASRANDTGELILSHYCTAHTYVAESITPILSK